MSATELARATVDALLASNISEVVLSPGSRNAPLSFALRAAERAGALRLHVRIDERSAGFLALGLAKGGGQPVAVCATSGTAIANLHPAVIEADLSRAPLLVVSANRPLSMQGTGANQTIDQVGIFGSATRATVHLADETPASWASGLATALDALYNSDLGPGPVQLDLGFTPPLTPDPGSSLAASVLETDGNTHRSTDRGTPSPAPTEIALEPRTLVLVAETTRELAESAIGHSTAGGFPVHVEAGTSMAAATSSCLQAGTFLLGSGELLDEAPPTDVLVVGRPTLNRQTAALLQRPGTRVRFVHAHDGWPNPSGLGVTPIIARSVSFTGAADSKFSNTWNHVDAAASEAVLAETGFDAGRAAATVADAAPGLLVVASSNPIRDVDERAARRPRQIVVNRGASGIDGLVSTTIGAALAAQRRGPGVRTVGLLGDLAFLHDINGLLIGPVEARPDVTIVVLNNDGGAIFASLEQGRAEYAEDFERVFGTPHGIGIPSLCEASGTPYRRAGTEHDLRAALTNPPGGIDVVEVRLDRSRERDHRRAVRDRVHSAIRAAL